MKQTSAKFIIKQFWPQLTISLVIILLIVGNYQPGTWLSGWDTLHPEFNFSLYFDRILNGAWQQHQGLGASPSQAHAAELPRLLILWLLSFILPVNAVRYAFFFLTLWLGSLGTFYLAKQLLTKSKLSLTAKISSLLAGLFYLLNPVTIQQYVVPFEMFAVHFASLPWLFYSAGSYLKSPKAKNLLFFLVVSIFSGSMGHTPTLFAVYFVALVLYLTTVSLINRAKLKVSITLIITTIVANAYWLGNTIYYAIYHGQEVIASRIHSLFTSTSAFTNHAFGNIGDVSKLRGYLFDWKILDFGSQEFVPLLGNWASRLNSPIVGAIVFTTFLIGISGAIITIIKKSKNLLPLVPVMILGLAFLIGNPLFSWLQNSSLLAEALRAPFNKFATITTFSLSVFIAFLTFTLLNRIKSVKTKVVAFLLLTATIFSIYLPAFQGQLFSPHVTVNIPQNYFELFDWFNTKPHNKRVAKLPLQSPWGWNYYQWGYQGAGFTWFGIPQPTLDREFDRWSPYNETFYNQASLALSQVVSSQQPVGNSEYKNNLSNFKNTLDQYDVSFLLLDESIIEPGKDQSYLKFDETKQVLADIGAIKVFESGFLTVYEVANSQQGITNSFINAPSEYSIVNANSTYSQVDPVYLDLGTYISDSGNRSLVTGNYPFTNFDPRSNTDISWQDGQVAITRPLNAEGDYSLLHAPYSQLSWPATVLAYQKDNLLTLTLTVPLPSVMIDDRIILNPDQILATSTLPLTGPIDYVFLDDQYYGIGGLGSEPTIIGYLNTNLPRTIQIQGTTIASQDGQDIFTTLSGETELILPGINQKINLNQKPTTTFTNPKNITIIYPVSTINNLNKLGNKQAKNCDILDRGQVERIILDNSATYTATDNATSCDHIDYSQYGGFDHYLLRVLGTNHEGRGLKIYLHTKDSQRVDLEQLSPTGKFDQSFVVYPSDNSGYVLNLDTKAFGRLGSTNTVDTISLIPFPAGWMQDIRLEPINLNDQTANIKNDLNITNTKKLGTSYYHVEAIGNGLITLNQGYEAGWIAFRLQETSNKLQSLLPWIYGEKLDHVKVNGWANGWLVAGSDGSSPSVFGPSRIVIFYWPQFLEWFGFGLLAVAIIYLTKKLITKN